jgi:hypothetical protein
MLDFNSISQRARQLDSAYRQKIYEDSQKKEPDILGRLASALVAGAGTMFGLPYVGSLVSGLGGAGSMAQQLGTALTAAGNNPATIITAAQRAGETNSIGDALLGSITDTASSYGKSAFVKELSRIVNQPQIDDYNRKLRAWLKKNPDYREGPLDTDGRVSALKREKDKAAPTGITQAQAGETYQQWTDGSWRKITVPKNNLQVVKVALPEKPGVPVIGLGGKAKETINVPMTSSEQQDFLSLQIALNDEITNKTPKEQALNDLRSTTQYKRLNKAAQDAIEKLLDRSL